MTSILSFMSNDHRHCDDLFVETEQAVSRNDFAAAGAAFGRFSAAVLAHFGGEEDTLFPAFEARTGIVGGPTKVMRQEHQQMRTLFEEAGQALQAADADAYLGVAETLLIMMQQHNLKEENILYPMCDRHLAAEAPAVLAQLEEAVAGGA